MAELLEVGQALFLGDTPIQLVQNNNFVSVNPYTEVIWTPADFSNVNAWWRADSGVTLHPVYRSKIEAWEDKINGYIVTQSFTASATYPIEDRMPSTGSSSNLNNQNTVHFEISTPSAFPSGAPNYLYSTGSWPSIAGSDFTMLMVIDYVAPYENNEGVLMGMTDQTSVKRFYFDPFSTPNDLRNLSGLGAASLQIVDSDKYINNNTPYFLGQYYNTTTADNYYYYNTTTGSLFYNGTVTNDTFATTTLFSIGGFMTGTGNLGALAIVRANDFHVAECVLIKGIPSASELAEWTNYVNTRYGSVILDSDAAAFVSASNITNITERTAINNLVIDLKETGLWSKMTAVYPFVGGTADSNKWNLVNPEDTDAAFRITWAGGITFDSNGITGNGTNGYGSTKINPNTNLNGGNAQNDNHVFAYLRVTSADAGIDIGVSDSGTATSYHFNSRNGSDIFNTRNMAGGLVDSQTGVTNTSGVFGMSRTSSSEYVKFINKSKSTVTTASSTPPNRTIFLMANNANGVAGDFQPRNMALVTFGAGLTSDEIDTLVDINETFQTTLGRFV